MKDFLSGTANAGNAFISHFATEQITGKPLAGWVIEPLKDTDRKDKFLTSLQEADTQMARAMDMDASMSNVQQDGKSMGAGSGSDKRVAMTNAVNTSYAFTQMITEPLRIVGKINGWPSNVRWVFQYDLPTTLNEHKSGTEPQTV